MKLILANMEPTIERIDNYEFDERFYRMNFDETTQYLPSVTYILSAAYPMDYGLINWRGDVGNKRADEIMDESATDGSFVHDAIDKMLNGEVINGQDISSMFSPKRSLKIKRCLKAFLDWYQEFKPTIISNEYVIWHLDEKYAGTVDLKCIINGETYIVDFKTSKTLHDSHKAQIAAYGMADPTVQKLALLQLGNTTKKKYTFCVLDDEEKLKYQNEFLVTNQLFKTLNPDARPNMETFPDVFSLHS